MGILSKRPFLVLIMSLLLVSVAGVFYAEAYLGKHYLKVAFLDIGQGDAIYIEAPNGNQVLIDGGRDNHVLARLSEVMPRGDTTLNTVIATHPDADHVGGLPSVFEKYTVGSFFEPGVYSDTKVYQDLESLAVREGSAHVLARKGTLIELDHEVILEILFPDGDVSWLETNDASIVARLTYGKTSFLLTGDSPIMTEDFLIQTEPDKLDSDILKLGHHGSRTSSSEEYLKVVSPSLAIISAGKNNSYGHPHKEVTDRLQTMHIPSLSTVDNGTIVIESDGEHYWQK